jgi:hypothetical protein
MELLTIYQTESFKNLPKVKKHIRKIEKALDIHIKKKQEHIPAVVGELAGTGLELLTNKYTSAALNMYALFQIANSSWAIVKELNSVGKTCDIREEFVKSLALNRALKLYKKSYKEQYDNLSPDKIVFSEPQIILPESNNFSRYCYNDDFDDEGREFGYFTTITFQKSKEKHLTYNFVIRIDGKIIASFSHEHDMK